MKAVAAHERRLASLARSARAAIVVPLLFASALFAIKQPEIAGFAVFGTFAHQVLVSYDAAGPARYAQSAMLTVFGAIMVGVGALVSPNTWLAVTGAVALGFLSELPLVAHGRIAAIRRALLLSFMLAVVVPAPVSFVFSYLLGWLMAGAIAQPALLLIWISPQNSSSTDEGARCYDRSSNAVAAVHLNSTADAVRYGLALGLAVLLTRLLKVEHAFWVVLGVLPVLNARSSSAARAFWQEQAGTLIGFLVSAAVVAIIGQHIAWYWSILPFVVFGSVYVASGSGLLPGQAAFTVFAVVLFCILSPKQKQAGILRLEDVAIGGAVSLSVGALARRGNGASVDRLKNRAKLNWLSYY